MRLFAIILASIVLSACAAAPEAAWTPEQVGPATYLLWSEKPGWAERHFAELGRAIARAQDFCAAMKLKPEIRTEAGAQERATFTCVAPAA
jgi:hypothetical protein